MGKTKLYNSWDILHTWQDINVFLHGQEPWCLTHWSLNNMGTILQMKFLIYFLWWELSHFNQISPQSVAKGSIGNKSALVLVMAQWWTVMGEAIIWMMTLLLKIIDLRHVTWNIFSTRFRLQSWLITWNGKDIHIIGPLWCVSTCHQWIPSQRASSVHFLNNFVVNPNKLLNKQMYPVIWDTSILIIIHNKLPYNEKAYVSSMHSNW